MSVADVIITILIWILENTIGRFPSEYGGLPIAEFTNMLAEALSVLVASFSLLDAFLPIGFLLKLVVIVIVAEVFLSVIWKGAKYIVNVIRGAGA